METLAHIPDLEDPRYLDEVGWFVSHEKYVYEGTDSSYAEQRVANSRIQLREFLEVAGRGEGWLEGKSVVTIGAGCTGDLSAWPAARKIAADPLMLVYQRLEMLIDDVCGVATEFITASAENLPLLDACADIVYCRNALNHIADPTAAVDEAARILNPGGVFFVDVDLGGIPTPDEPVVFTASTLEELLGRHFRVRALRERGNPHSKHSPARCEFLLEHRPGYHAPRLDRGAVLAKYMGQFGS